MQQGTNPAAAGTLPSDTEIAAVTTWRNPYNAAWTYADLINAGYSDWAIAGDYIFYKYKDANKTPRTLSAP